jgi:hypothetical protein
MAPAHTIGYLLENVPAEFNYRSSQVRQDAVVIDEMLGAHVVTDAVQHGSYAHRVRALWTNIVNTRTLQAALNEHKPPHSRKVDDILDQGRTAQVAFQSDRWPRYKANIQGKQLKAWPMLMSHPYSFAYRKGKQGQVYNRDGTTAQPTAEERERAMGYPEGATAAVGVTNKDRMSVLGKCMDGWCMQAVWATMMAIHHRQSATPCLILSEGTRIIAEPTAGILQDSLQANASNVDSILGNCDIWEDSATMRYLQSGQIQGMPTKEKARVRKRAMLFQWRAVSGGISTETKNAGQGALLRIMPDLTTRIVPRVEERRGIVEEMHCRSGHFGVRRTMGLLSCSHWWRGMRRSVVTVCKACAHCGKANATFTSASKQLHPLPIMGLFYRWGVDLCGPFPTSTQGNRYIMIAIEHYSKHAEVIPITEAKSDTTTRAFLQHVLSKFGACAEVVTDGGSEFKGRFSALLQDCYIDHMFTSAEHPQSNGLAERCVQTIKKCLGTVIDEK